MKTNYFIPTLESYHILSVFVDFLFIFSMLFIALDLVVVHIDNGITAVVST